MKIDGYNTGMDVGKTDDSDDGSNDDNNVGTDIVNEDNNGTDVGLTDWSKDGSNEDDRKKDWCSEDEGTDEGAHVQSRHDFYFHWNNFAFHNPNYTYIYKFHEIVLE